MNVFSVFGLLFESVDESLRDLQVHLVRGEAGHLLGDLGLEQLCGRAGGTSIP